MMLAHAYLHGCVRDACFGVEWKDDVANRELAFLPCFDAFSHLASQPCHSSTVSS